MAYVNKRSGRTGQGGSPGSTRLRMGRIRVQERSTRRSAALEVAEAAERHALLQLAEASPADKATVTLATYMEVFLSAADIEANSKETYART
jgi:hypothetical protein